MSDFLTVAVDFLRDLDPHPHPALVFFQTESGSLGPPIRGTRLAIAAVARHP